MKNKAVFLDRDGVINEMVFYKEIGIIDSPASVEQYKILPKVPLAIKNIKKLGYKIIIISNQPGIAKNKFTPEIFEKIRDKMITELNNSGAEIDAEYYCFHHPYATVKKYKKICDCRKPKPGSIIKAAKDHSIDLSKSWMIGDGITDIKAGHDAGCKTILIGRMKCDLCKYMDEENVKPDFITPSLYDASLIIEKE
jgi:D-glycero-D-manno-heptose 1,7-bisphosphate phosphatase